MSLVLDASVALAWVFGEEPGSELRRLFDGIADNGAVVPGLWWLEVANTLTVAVRRKRIDSGFRAAALRDLALLDIDTDEQTGPRTWSDVIVFADEYKLTVYDAAYLELAQRRGLPLASLDAELRAAAGKANVRLAPI